MLYKKNTERTLSRELFSEPTSEYRGTPFWAWNSKLERDELLRQIDIFKKMGLGGFHMHVRTGLENTYMSDEFLGLVRSCVDKAKSENMLAWLYDEDRWPSGAAGGIVTENHAFRQRCIVFSTDYEKTVRDHNSRSEDPDNDNDIKLLTCYDIVLDEYGYLKSYKQIDKDAPAQGMKWYLFLWIETPDSWYNDKTYVDTLNPEAIREFVRVTHDKYKECCGDEFDKTVPAIFTDEPQVSRKHQLRNSFDRGNISMPWTDALPDLYKERYGADIYEHLPEIIWELPQDKYSPHRYYYHDIISDVFANAFSKTIGDWCRENNLAFTGHMMEEPSLESQTHSVGEAMRSYGNFGIPGIDMLCNSVELSTAKQCQSAVHQYGKEGMLSELYGVTSWDCDFRTYKFGGDWQAALGVTVRVPHLSWYAMQGEAKRDYPASISYQSPWYEKYKMVEDHFGRLNTALTRGKPVVKVGVIHPVESYWLHYGPNDKTELFRRQLEDRFSSVTGWLLEGSIDFDFISEALLPELNDTVTCPLKVGEMEYDAVVVPGCETLRSTTVEKLSAFVSAGGRLIFMGQAPAFCDALKSGKSAELYERSVRIDFSRAELYSALEDFRTLTIRSDNGSLTNNYMYQLRQDNDCRWLFICRIHETDNKEISEENGIVITVKGEFKAEIWDTSDGSVRPANVSYLNGNTVIRYTLRQYDSLLLRLAPGKEETKGEDIFACHRESEFIKECESFSVSEDNVLLLDMAEWSVDGGEMQEAEEILRLDNKAREIAGLCERAGHVCQPYAVRSTAADHRLKLVFRFDSEIEYHGADLALEDYDKAEIVFNGKSVESKSKGNFVDIKIFRVPLPDIVKGENILEITLPLGERTNTENVFILGKFGVRVQGRKAVIIPFPESIEFGDLTCCGFPFYGGTVSYKFKAKASGGKLIIKANNFKGTVMTVLIDGSEAGDIAYPPYTVIANGVSDGVHDVEIRLYLHRYNCFGPVHLSDKNLKWHGPNAWRSEGDSWSYEYMLRPTGLFTAPVIMTEDR